MKRIAKSAIGIVIAFIMVFSMPASQCFAQTKDSGNYKIESNIQGAEIYINGEYGNACTSSKSYIAAKPGDVISLVCPGYSAEDYTIRGDEEIINVELTEELYPAQYDSDEKHITIPVGSGETYQALSEALTYAKTLDDSVWCVIELKEGADTGSVSEELFRGRNHYTIYGGENGSMMNSLVNPWGVEGLRLINLDFSGMNQGKQFSIRAPGDTIGPAIYTKDIYILGCVFMNAEEFGIYQCVEFNKGGTSYDSDGTYNVSNINWINNTITGALFNFAAAGDGDYNVIDGYTVMANTINNGCIAFLTADAHSWYVYYETSENLGNFDASGDYTNHEIGFCEYNVIKNVLVSGNTIYNGEIGLGAANLGNKHNTLENAAIRNNIVYNDHTYGPDFHSSSGLHINNVTVADNYEGTYQHVDPSETHCDYNTTQNIEVYDNYFQCDRNSSIINVLPSYGEQCGSNNTLSHISVRDNTFDNDSFFAICNYGGIRGTAGSNKCEDNVMTDIEFKNNILTHKKVNDSAGIIVAGAYMSKHGEQYDNYADYSGTISEIKIHENTINGYIYGVQAAGCIGDYLNGNSLEDVEIYDNTIHNENPFNYAVCDIGILAAGSTGQTTSNEYSANLANENGTASNFKIKNNDIVARAGIVVGGLVATKSLDKPSINNTISNVVVENNNITQRPQQPEFVNMGDPDSVASGIIVGSSIAYNDNLITENYSIDLILQNNQASEIALNGNVFSEYNVDYENGIVDSSWENISTNSGKLFKKQVGAFEVYSIHEHSGTLVSQVNPTCSSDGVKEYYICDCGEYFEDSDCQNNIVNIDNWRISNGKISKLPHTEVLADNSVEATCGIDGKESDTVCSVCGETVKTGTIIPATGNHTIKTTTINATTTNNGKITYTCEICGKSTAPTKVIYYPKTINLSKTSYVYNAEVQKPSITVKGSDGKTISPSNYTVTYSSDCKNIGKYTVKITFKGNYSGSVSKTYTIVPKGTSIKSLTPRSKKITVKWTKQAAQTTGYQIQYSTSSKFTSAKTVTVSKNSTVSATLSKLTGKKRYYVRIRTYKTVSGTKYYSPWSSAKYVTTKK